MTVRLLHLTGSAVSAFHADLSCLYARDALATLHDPARYETHLAYVSPDGSWRFPSALTSDAIAEARPLSSAAAIERITGLGIGAMVPQMFCLPGMTTYRGLFDLLRIPYLGNRPQTMAVGAAKAQAKAIVSASGVRVATGELVSDDGGDSAPESVVALPAVVKPADGDNSEGVSFVSRRSEVEPAVRRAWAASVAREALVEEYVELGREVRCGTVMVDGKLICLPLEEYALDPSARPIRTAADKLRRDTSGDLHLVAKEEAYAWILPEDDPVTAAVWEAGMRCHRALGCRHYGLFDFRVDPSGEPVFLEASLYCSFARKSVLSVMAAAAGMGTPDLFRLVLQQAMGPASPP